MKYSGWSDVFRQQRTPRGATRTTLRQFLGADEELDHIVRDILIPAV